MIKKKTWEEFRETGLFWWVNSLLHLFGWVIVFEVDGDEVKDVYPARTTFRGFDEQSTSQGFQKVTRYMRQTAKELENEVWDNVPSGDVAALPGLSPDFSAGGGAEY